MIVGTAPSRALCKLIAQKTDTIVFGFSRGKDSIATWLWLMEFFPRIIPFHVDGCPGLRFVEDSLKYYEKFFGTAIERHVNGELFQSISNMIYQPIEDEPWIDELNCEATAMTNDQIAEYVRSKHDAKDAWFAWGIASSDSIIRRSQAKYRNGINEAKRTFYPIFDWRREHISQAIAASGVKLPRDYLLSNRSYASPLNLRGLSAMRDDMPEEFERVKFFYPLIEASLARNEFRKAHFAVGSSTLKSPSDPLTENGSIGRTLPRTQAKQSSSGSQQAAASSPPNRNSLQSSTSTITSPTPAGSEP